MFTSTCCRVKGFASRGSLARTRADVLCLPFAFHEGQWVLHRLLDGLEEAVGGALHSPPNREVHGSLFITRLTRSAKTPEDERNS